MQLLVESSRFGSSSREGVSKRRLRFVVHVADWLHYLGVRGAPWSAANRLHGQRTGAFSWRPVLGLSRKTDQFRLDPTQNCAPGWWCDRESSVYHLALEMYSGIFRHTTNHLALSRMPTKHQLHPYPHPTHHSHDYHTNTPTVTNPTAFHAQLLRF